MLFELKFPEEIVAIGDVDFFIYFAYNNKNT